MVAPLIRRSVAAYVVEQSTMGRLPVPPSDQGPYLENEQKPMWRGWGALLGEFARLRCTSDFNQGTGRVYGQLEVHAQSRMSKVLW